MDNQSNQSPLPRCTVKYVNDPNQMNEAAIRGMLSNPVYVGIPPYRRVVSDEAWIRAAVELINEDGPEQFLVNMLYMLRVSMVDAVPDEAIPEDYDGPWPDEEEDEVVQDENSMDFAESPSPWHYPMEGMIYCSHDDFPMILIDDDFICVAEYLDAHINSAPITDLITEPDLALVFQNGHTLPLLCPHCGDSLHFTDDSWLLDSVNGLTIVDMDWDIETEELILAFGQPNGDDEEEALKTVAIHLDSVRGLTCPHKQGYEPD